MAEASLGDLRFRIIDTAGLEDAEPDELGARMQEQTARALEEADVALFLVDAREGVTPLDRHFADRLRRLKTPVIVVANKAEGSAFAGALEAFALGLGDPVAISAEHGEGLDALFRGAGALCRPRRSRGAGAGRGQAPAPARHRRPPQCRQVDLGQPPARRGAAC